MTSSLYGKKSAAIRTSTHVDELRVHRFQAEIGTVSHALSQASLDLREGSKWSPGFNRAGCRTPMQWDDAEPNAGFSTAAPEDLYLPQDPGPHRPTVASQRAQDDSTLNRVRRLIQLRRTIPDLRAASSTEVLADGYPLVYRRGDQHLVVINPAGAPRDVAIAALQGRSTHALEVDGVTFNGSHVAANAFGYGVFRLTRDEPGLA